MACPNTQGGHNKLARLRHCYKTVCGDCTGAFSPSQPAVMVSQQPQQQQQQQPGVVTVIREVPVGQPSVVDGYMHRQSVVLGIFLIVVAVLSATFHIVHFAVTFVTFIPLGYGDSGSVYCHGIWGGILVRTTCTHSFSRQCYTPFTRYNRLYTRYSRLSKRLSNGFDNRLYSVYKHSTGCQTGLTTGCIV